MSKRRISTEEKALLAEARSIARRSQAPPQARAGALAVTRRQERFPGVTVQLTAAAGLTVCAEHVALTAARAGSSSPIDLICLWVPRPAGEHPCGRCLQIWKELAPQARFLLQRGDDEPYWLDHDQLLPDAFTHFDPST